LEVPIHVAASHDKERYGRYKTKNDFLALCYKSEIYIQPMYEFKGEKSWVVVLPVEGLYYTIKRSLSKLRGSDDEIIIFEFTESGAFGRVTQRNWYENRRNLDTLIELESLEFRVPMVCLATGRVSQRRDGRYLLSF
jgi:hypothetical protein